MESFGQIIVSVAIAATAAFGGFQISTEAHIFWSFPPSTAVGNFWSPQIAKFNSGKTPAIFTHPDLAVGLLTLSLIGARLKFKR